jgi:hypothetical protein
VCYCVSVFLFGGEGDLNWKKEQKMDLNFKRNGQPVQLLYANKTVLIKKKEIADYEILTHATTWMDLKNMLSEISQSRKGKYCMISLTRET